MAATKTETRLIAGGYDAVFRAVCDAAVAQGMVVTAADPASGGIQLKTNMTMMTWGENLGVGVRPTPSGTEVTITSSLKFGLVDWGKNNENIGNLFYRIGSLVAAPAGAWHPDPSGRHELRWWDGARWTESVSNRGQVGTDTV
jgi:hypothetical protein